MVGHVWRNRKEGLASAFINVGKDTFFRFTLQTETKKKIEEEKQNFSLSGPKRSRRRRGQLTFAALHDFYKFNDKRKWFFFF